jgi:hypothetical protein
VIDIVDALDLLDRCVRDRGKSYRSPTCHERAILPLRTRCTGRAVTDSIVTLAVSKAGLPLTAISQLAGTSLVAAYARGQNPLNLTLGAVVVLHSAESVERRGETWGVALQAALGAAPRFLYLLPVGVSAWVAEQTAASHRCAHRRGSSAGVT